MVSEHGDGFVRTDADGAGHACIDRHLDVAIMITHEPRLGDVNLMIDGGPLDHLRTGLPTGAGSAQMGTIVDAVKGGFMLGEFILHGSVDVIEILLCHEPLADALLTGDDDELEAAGFEKGEGLDDAVTQMEIFPPGDVATTRGHIYNTVAVEEESRMHGFYFHTG